MAVFGNGRCHAGCKGAKGDLAVEVASFSQSGFMLANRLLDESTALNTYVFIFAEKQGLED